MAEKAAERLVWAVETLAVQPADRLLEIGCGHGVAVSLVCPHLAGGRITAIDRSPKMIAMAQQRNAACIAAGTATFQTLALHDADFGERQFDKIFAIHVGVFLRGQPGRELAIIKRHLAPAGRFHLVYQPLQPEQAGAVTEQLASVLTEHGFRIRERLRQELTAGTVVCVIAES
jgi:cyclopropane fatty-acyl-phospholipid synthase-like methyltransferase